jgi:hypothetical protein
MTRSSVAALLALGNLLGATLPAQSSPDLARGDQERSSQQQPGQHVQFDVARFDSLTARLLSEIFDSAASRGLPASKLVLRALEGAAKRQNGTKIVQVVRDHANALADAREALGAGSTAAELDVGASALKAGIDTRTLSTIRGLRAGSVEMPLMVLTDIVLRGVPAATARDAVTTLARMPKSDDALMGLQSTVAKNAVRGPGMALDALNRYVKGTVSGSAPPSTPVTTDRKPIRPPTP